MAEKPEEKPKRPKVFPFAGMVDVGGQKKTVDILFLAPIGILARGKDLLVKVGSFYSVSFDLPNGEASIEARMRVFKTYDRAGAQTDHMAELQFDNLATEMKNKIASFNKNFGQK